MTTKLLINVDAQLKRSQKVDVKIGRTIGIEICIQTAASAQLDSNEEGPRHWNK